MASRLDAEKQRVDEVVPGGWWVTFDQAISIYLGTDEPPRTDRTQMALVVEMHDAPQLEPNPDLPLSLDAFAPPPQGYEAGGRFIRFPLEWLYSTSLFELLSGKGMAVRITRKFFDEEFKCWVVDMEIMSMNIMKKETAHKEKVG